MKRGEKRKERKKKERGERGGGEGEREGEKGGDRKEGGPGFLAVFDPNERREVTAKSDARLVLILGPWPGEGHPSRR